MADPEVSKEVIAPPNPPYQLTGINKDLSNYLKDLYNFNYLMWKRTGSYNSIIPDLSGLKASVNEINTLLGVNTSRKLQSQINQKENKLLKLRNNILTLCLDINSLSNTGIYETDMLKYNLVGNVLYDTNYFLEIDSHGTFSNNANIKTLKLYFGNNLIFNTGNIAFNGGYWHIKAKIIKKSSSTQQCIVDIITSDTLLPSSTVISNSTEDLTIDNIIKCTGQSSSSNDITQNGLIIKLYN